MIEPGSMVRLLRLLLNDVDPAREVFGDGDLSDFLALEEGSVKRAAAQAIDTNADNELLASKVLTDHQVSTNGAAVADSMRKRAAALRSQADREQAAAADEADGFYFGTVAIVAGPDPHAWYV